MIIFSYDNAIDKKVTYSVTFKAVGVGSTKLAISYENGNVVDFDVNDFNVKKSEGSVTISAPRQASTDCTLSALVVGQGKISPAFNKNTLNYTISVGADVKALTLNAKATSPYAKVAVSGNSLKSGTNTVKILVTAESGATKTYTITVTKANATPTPVPTDTPIPSDTPTPTPGIMTKARVFETDENGKASEKLIDLQLADKLSVAPPEDYQKEDANILGIMVEVYRQPESNVVLVELSDGQLYIYNSEEESFTLFRTMNPLKRNYRICLAPEDKIPAGYTLYSEEINGISYPAYKKDGDSEFSLMYIDEGAWYSYDTREQTLQRYNEENAAVITVIPEISPKEPTPMPVEPTVKVPDESSSEESAGERLMPGDETATKETATPDKAEDGDDGDKNDKIKSIVKIAVVVAVFLLAILFMCLYVGERRKSYAIPEINEEEIKNAVAERISSEHVGDTESKKPEEEKTEEEKPDEEKSEEANPEEAKPEEETTAENEATDVENKVEETDNKTEE
ncbi:MAG: cadherin-like beta sandwich domain-containing protein [Lachnospiraceae bacterium]|nr:cadherin-like beta sandwich domain-containing protein [Lachnospiraceae bacterium]